MKETRLAIEADLSRVQEWLNVKTMQIYVLKQLKNKMNLTMTEFKK